MSVTKSFEWNNMANFSLQRMRVTSLDLTVWLCVCEITLIVSYEHVFLVDGGSAAVLLPVR